MWPAVGRASPCSGIMAARHQPASTHGRHSSRHPIVLMDSPGPAMVSSMFAGVVSRIIILSLGFTLIVACRDDSLSAPDPPQVAPRTYDPDLCPPDPGLDATTVASTGYDGLYAEHPSAKALLRDAECPWPEWRGGVRPCSESWYYSPTAGEARLQLLWQAWCWHGADLQVQGRVECDQDAVVVGTIHGGSQGRFRCVIEYEGTRAERDVLRGRHASGVIETF